jgi:hypothetical protein
LEAFFLLGYRMLNGMLANSNYLSVALALVGIVGGGFVSWIITFAYFRKAQTRKQMCYANFSTNYLGYNQGDFHDLTVRYGDKLLKNPFRYTLYIWNSGNVTINRADISDIDPLAFGRADIDILETNPIWTTRESTNPKLLIDVTKKKVVFEFDFLDPNDGFAVQFLADKADSDTWWQTNLQCYGTIKGLTRSPYQVEAKFTKTHWWSLFIGTAVFSFFGICALAMGYDAWLSGLSFLGLMKALATAIFALIAVFAAMITFQDRVGSSAEVIPALLRRANDNSSEDGSIPPGVLLRLGHRPR